MYLLNEYMATLDERTNECPQCHGEGRIYTQFDCITGEITEVDADTYNSLPDDEDEAYDRGVNVCKCEDMPCHNCDCTGEVSVEIDRYTWEGDRDR